MLLYSYLSTFHNSPASLNSHCCSTRLPSHWSFDRRSEKHLSQLLEISRKPLVQKHVHHIPNSEHILWANAEWTAHNQCWIVSIRHNTVLCMTAWFSREKPNRWKVLRVGQTHLQSWERAVCENFISLLAKGSELISDQRTGCIFKKKKCLN